MRDLEEAPDDAIEGEVIVRDYSDSDDSAEESKEAVYSKA